MNATAGAPPPSAQDVAALAANVVAIQLTKYCLLATLVVTVYDQLITFGQEVELIWPSRWSIVKVVFYTVRYNNVFQTIFNMIILFWPGITPGVSLAFYRSLGATGIILIFTTESILQFRIYAMYNLNKKILALMLPCFFGAMAGSAAVLTIHFKQERAAVTTPLPGMPFCVALDQWPHLYTYWFPIIAFEALLFGLALRKAYTASLRSYKLAGWSGSATLDILIRDSILYFLVIFVTYLINTLIWSVAPDQRRLPPVFFSYLMSSVMTQRLLFNIRANNNSELRTTQLTRDIVFLHTHELSDLSAASEATRIAPDPDV